MANFSAALDVKDIELIPGMGLSLGDVLKLILNYWQPDNTVGKQIKINLDAALRSANAKDLCDILTGRQTVEAIFQAITQLLTRKLSMISSALGTCNIDCTSGKPTGVSVAKAVLSISVKSFDGDGVSFGALIASVVQEIVCCTLQIGVNAAIKKIDPSRILGKMRDRCAKLLASVGDQAGHVIAASSNAAGYGGVAAPEAQIDAAVRTMGASVADTSRAQANALQAQAANIRQDGQEKTQVLYSQIADLQIYEAEFKRLLAAGGNSAARIQQLQSGLAAVQKQIAGLQASAQEALRPYETQAQQILGQAEGVRTSAGITSSVNWKPLLVAAGSAVVGSGLVLFSPVVIVGGAIALLTGLLRRKKT